MFSKSRSDELNDIFHANVIDITQLRKLCIDGCPEKERALVWKILLNLVPLKKNEWEFHLRNARQHYEDYIREFVIEAGQNGATEDHPLSCDPNSRWVEYFKDNEVLLQINKDCKRLCPDLNFFQQITPYPLGGIIQESKGENILRKRIESSILETETWKQTRMGVTVGDKQKNKNIPYYDYDNLHNVQQLNDYNETHWEAIQRILFIYCKTNRAHSYVQGMNEIIGPLYYVFSTATDETLKRTAEADTFYCFIEIMRDVQQLFIKSLDADPLCGIQYRLCQFMEYLKDIDLELFQRLEELKLQPEYFAFRWVTLYLSREFTMPDVIRLWDSLFSVKNRLNFMIYVCCALIVLLKNKLMESNFAQAMFLVQNVQDSNINIDEVMRKSLEYYFRYGDS